MLTALRGLISGLGKVGSEYSPENALPRVSRGAAGTVELGRSLGPEVVSSADLMQYATHQWSPEQLADHRVTVGKLGLIVNEAFAYAGERLAAGVTEFQVAEFIRERFAEENIASPDGPIVAVNANASDPHYEPSTGRTSAIKQGDWLLIDLWAKGTADGSVYADSTWVAYVGDTVPQRQQEIFDIVTGARDAALHYLEDAHNQGTAVQRWQADQVARDFISSRGYGEYFTHRLGPSIGFEVHSEAVNLDGFETHNTPPTLPALPRDIPSDLPCIRRVAGHTDSNPIHTAEFASNWELSSARALSVVYYLIGQGVPPDRLAAAGFGEFQPIDPGVDEIGFRRNRRIELKLTTR